MTSDLEKAANARGLTLTTEDGYKAAAEAMSIEAEVADMARCINGEAVFNLPGEYAVKAGHIYSEAGVDEYRISKCCEFHFDEMFADPSCDCGQQCCNEESFEEEN